MTGVLVCLAVTALIGYLLAFVLRFDPGPDPSLEPEPVEPDVGEEAWQAVVRQARYVLALDREGWRPWPVSLARFGWKGSHVYVFECVTGQMECCGCSLQDGGSFRTKVYADLTTHLEKHRAEGHTVPDEVFAAIAYRMANEGPMVRR